MSVPAAFLYRVDSTRQYRLRVSFTENGTGPFAFRVVTPKERRFTARLGATVSGTLDVPGRVDIYTVTAAASGRIEMTKGGAVRRHLGRLRTRQRGAEGIYADRFAL